MSQATLAIKRISGHAGPAPGEDVERGELVCKLVDTPTCIGCKACEVGEANETVVAGGVGCRDRCNSSRNVHRLDCNLWNTCTTRVLDHSLDACGELSEGCIGYE